MGFKMLTAFMISRSHIRPSLLTTALAIPLLAAACQKVPLLAPSGSTISLTASNTAVPSNGTVQPIAQVLQPAVTPPHSGAHGILTTSLGTMTPSAVDTDPKAQARATLGASGT